MILTTSLFASMFVRGGGAWTLLPFSAPVPKPHHSHPTARAPGTGLNANGPVMMEAKQTQSMSTIQHHDHAELLQQTLQRGHRSTTTTTTTPAQPRKNRGDVHHSDGLQGG